MLLKVFADIIGQLVFYAIFVEYYVFYVASNGIVCSRSCVK